jgi:hypothetical protein
MTNSRWWLRHPIRPTFQARRPKRTLKSSRMRRPALALGRPRFNRVLPNPLPTVLLGGFKGAGTKRNPRNGGGF